MGGNIGRAVMTLDPPTPERFYVVECSSYQIDLSPSINPTAGILLNLTPDHLDRHGTMQHYAAIKERLVAGSETAIIGVDDVYCAQIADRLERAGKEVIRISKRLPLPDGYFADGTDLMEAIHGRYSRIGFLEGIGSLRGQHNAQNALAAVAACLKAGLDLGEIQSGLESFPGLAHRMEQVGRKDHVLFVNDSKATNADAAAPALSTFQRIYWIAGGLPKEGGIEPLRSLFPAHRQGLSDRRGRAGLFGDARRSGALRDFGHAGRRGRARRGRRGARRDRRSRRSAFPGLRKLRPVQEFRGTRRSVQGGRRGHRGSSTDRRGALMPSRVDKSPVATWWWTVDRWFLAAFLSLMGLGIVLSFAASPAVAERIGLDSFHFATRQIIFTIPALGAMLFVSFLDARQIRRMSIIMLVRHAAC